MFLYYIYQNNARGDIAFNVLAVYDDFSGYASVHDRTKVSIT